MTSQKEIVEAVAKELSKKDLSQQAATVLQRATAKVLERVKQNIDAQVKEDSSPIVESFTKNVAQKLSGMTQQWADNISNDLIVFPEGTRYIFTDGCMKTIVVEQPPQVRTLHIYNRWYNLALPYVQFLIPFREGTPQGALHVTCTKKSITDLDQALNFFPLPNMNNNHTVCTGNTRFPTDGNMTEAVNQIISDYWQSAFTSSLNEYCNAFSTENNLSLGEWETKSKKDPLFIIGKGIKYRAGRTIRGQLYKDQNSKVGTASIVTKLKQEIVTAVGSIGGDIQNLLSTMDLAVENREKVHIETLQNILKEIIVQAYSELWEYVQKQLKEDRAKLQKEMQEAALKLKKEFQYFMEEKKKVW